MPARSRVRRDCRCPRARHQHGSRGAYQIDGCRCFTCRLNYAARRAALRDGMPIQGDFTTSIGLRRRLEALHVLGWSDRQLGARLGVTRQATQQLRTRERCLRASAAAVAALYDELWNQPPPASTDAERLEASITRGRARSRGWLPPLAWDDDDIDELGATPSPIAVGTHVACGTETGYQAHRQRGEQTCQACRHAAHKANKAREERRRAGERAA